MLALSRFSDSPDPTSARLRTGQGWDEATASDLLGEILNVYPEHTKKALALLSGEF